jgi:hypothetical protein
LGLDEVGARGDLLPQSQKCEPRRIEGRVRDGANVHRRVARDGQSVHQAVVVAQPLDQLHEVDRIDVVDAHRRRVVPQLLVVAGQAEHVANSQRRCAEDVALQGQPIAVAQGQLQDRLGARLLEQHAPGQAGHPDHGDLVVGDVDRVTRILEEPALLEHDLGLATARRPCLGGNGELPACENAFQLAT